MSYGIGRRVVVWQSGGVGFCEAVIVGATTDNSAYQVRRQRFWLFTETWWVGRDAIVGHVAGACAPKETK